MKNLFKRADGQKITDERIGPLLGEALGSLQENGECPVPADFAALSESKIAGEERERLLLHLAGCDKCRAAYSMVCEMAPGEEAAARTDLRWQARRLVPLAAAAGLILIIVSWPLLTHRESILEEGPATTTRTLAKEKMESARIAAATDVPSPVTQAVRPEVPTPAKESASANAASKAMESPKLMVSPAAEAPRPAAQAESKHAAPDGEGGYLGLSHEAPEAHKQVDEFEPHFIAAPITKTTEAPQEPSNLHRRVEIDEGQRLRLSKADAATFDKAKIEGIFKDLKLDTCGFPLQDINKVVVQWTGSPRRSGKLAVSESGESAAGIQPGAREKVQANISLEDGGVLTIDVQGTPLLRKNRGAKIPVGC